MPSSSASQFAQATTHNLTQALKYAEDGFRVFPVYEPTPNSGACSCLRPDCTSIGKHPRTQHGFKDASLDPDVISQWWLRSPEANIAIATGRQSNLVVLDVDERNGGLQSLAALEEQFQMQLPPTLTAETGGGLHFYFLAPEEPVSSKANALGPGLDIRAESGYVVAPPSLHSNGKTYEFVNPGADIAPMPEWFVATSQTRLRCESQKSIEEGTRNDTLTRIAGSLRFNGAELPEIQAELHAINQTRCNPPLPDREVNLIAASIAGKAAGPGTRTRSCDASEMSQQKPYWFKFDVGWWNNNINFGQMDAEQRGWYLTLLLKAYPAAGVLPADMPALWRLAGASTEKKFIKKCNVVLDEFERHEEDGRPFLVHRMVEAQYSDANQRMRQASDAGKKSAAGRRRSEP